MRTNIHALLIWPATLVAMYFGCVGTLHAQSVETFKRLGIDKPFFEGSVNGRSNSEIMQALSVPEDAQYNPCAEAYPPDDIPRGTVKHFKAWKDAKLYPDTERDIAIYTPAQLEASTDDPALIVFNDGLGYLNPIGPVRASAVLDTLIAAGEMPPTVAVFVMPGKSTATTPAHRNQRSYEYDRLTDTYVRFLSEEILPLAEKEIGRKFTTDPNQRAICGISSGGICAFNAAWHNPDAFGLVISHCGSFTNIAGGHNFPYLVRSTPRKPIRVFLTSGQRDARIVLGDWPLANKQMDASLGYAGYDYKFVFGEGGHSLRHGGAIFADTLRWLWR